jgi:16S rRNA A1518/A1519 N6-dimethyltransferase RsmA/KsgA/DIM1 with predicted DNA glycosylase/AP lyase activity
VKRAFSQRRKMLSNLLPIDLRRRAETLSVEEYAKLTDRLRFNA